MDFDLEDLTEEQKRIIQEVDGMLIPELMGAIENYKKQIFDYEERISLQNLL